MQFCEADRNPLRRKTSESLLKFLAIGAYPAVMRPNFPIISINVSFPSSISFSNLLVGLINKMAFLLFSFCHGLLKLSLDFGFSLSPGRKILRRRHAANHTKFPSTGRSTRANASRFLPDNKMPNNHSRLPRLSLLHSTTAHSQPASPNSLLCISYRVVRPLEHCPRLPRNQSLAIPVRVMNRVADTRPVAGSSAQRRKSPHGGAVTGLLLNSL